jgi:hypothetical protein
MSRLCRVVVAVSVLGVWTIGCGSETTTESVGPTESFVCGTDGKTYSVEEADTGGHDVAHRGRCEEPMHCDSPDDCFVGDECADPSDGPWCVPGPTRCSCPGVFEPVCGGDGRNYINACEAACAGVGIQHGGYCDEPPPGAGCVRAGCSAHLCVEEGIDIASTCEWRPVYECYQQATCERQENGQCGFTPTHELVECLERHGEGMCELDPRWNDGFQAECESPQAPGIVGIIEVRPYDGMLRLGEPFRAELELLEPPVLPGVVVPGEGVLTCAGEETRLQGLAPDTPLGTLEFDCSILGEIAPGECLDDSDCPPGHYCELGDVWWLDEQEPRLPPPPPPGVCVDLCALVDCAPGYRCEYGECVPEELFCTSDWDCPPGLSCQDGTFGGPFEGAPIEGGLCQPCLCLDIYDPVCGADGQTYGNGCEASCNRVEIQHEGECDDACPVDTHIRNFRGECVPKCYGPEQCADGQSCNSFDVCRQDPACPQCDVCVGWCVDEPSDCRETGCAAGFTCENCKTADGGAEWTCLPPDAGICEPPDDCRPTGCNGEICANEDVASPCVALPEFACYAEHGVCEVQAWGECGWTRTPELDQCLSDFDCRSTGCAEGDYCTFCWFDWACIPEGAVC